MIFKKEAAEEATTTNTSPVEKTKEKALDQSQDKNYCITKFKTDHRGVLEAMIKADNKIKRYQKVFTYVNSMYEERKRNSIISSIEFSPSPCDSLKASLQTTVGINEVLKLYGGWDSTASSYLTALSEKMNAIEAMNAAFESFKSDPQKQKCGDTLAQGGDGEFAQFVDIESQYQEAAALYQQIRQQISLQRREFYMQKTFGPLKLKYATVMGNLCSMQTKYKKYMKLIGVGRREDLAAIVQLYEAAIDILREAIQLVGQLPSGEKEQIVAGFEQTIEVLESEQQTFASDTYKRLFPNYSGGSGR